LAANTERATPADKVVVERQLGRAPRGAWRVAARCRHDFPQAIATAPELADGTPFPTLYWLTCPFLVEEIDDVESAGGVDEWAERLATDPVSADRMRAADAEYRRRRAMEGRGSGDPCAAVGVAGQRDPLATKCLHAHLAASLAGVEDPVGEGLLETLGDACSDARCGDLTCLREERDR